MSMDGKHRSFREQVEKQPDYRYDVRNEIIINNDTMIFEEEYNVKVLMLNGSAKANGNTYASLLEVGRQLEKEGIEYEIFQMGGEPVRDCLGCGQCTEHGCVFADDKVNEFVAKAKEADGFVFGTPVYYAHPSGRIMSFLDRAFYSGGAAFRFKPGMAVASARRAGTTASLDAINKYFGINQMPTVGSTYWNMVHGNCPEEVRQDLEGLQTMRNAAKCMAWMLKCFEAGKAQNIALPDTKKEVSTNFIR